MRALKAVVFIWIAVVGPLSLIALPVAVWLHDASGPDPLSRIVFNGSAFIAFIVSGYAPWMIAERIRKHEAARALQTAGRSVVRSDAAAPPAWTGQDTPRALPYHSARPE